MAWYRSGGSGGSSAEDGNDITYPVQDPEEDNKLYSEMDVNDIALAIGSNVKVSEMADAIRSMSGGLKAIEVNIQTAQYTSSDLGVT